MTTFSTLGLSEPLVRGVLATGYTTPTPLQAAAIPVALDGRDLTGCAQTGTGKTAAFVLPMLDRLAAAPTRRGPRRPRALVVTPTRELA
ncbi:MAG: DEAD/DEAH box helicase, partial [Rubricoccaceae bacterium]|nr:DEAD/DEAH box helicase [Rubricoccaceae bacterium]